MIRCFTQKNRIEMLILSVLTLIIFGAAGFFSLPVANAQGLYMPQFGFSSFPRYPYNFAPQVNQLGGINYWRANNYSGASTGLFPSAALTGSPSPTQQLRAAHAYINGATTVFIPPSSTNLRVSIKPGTGIPGIKLSALVAPLTIYIYPSGYVPPAPTTIAPTTTTAPAVISGLRQQVFPSYSRSSAYSLGQTFYSPRITPSFVPFMAL